MKSQILKKVYTVIPNDFEFSTQHFDTKHEAEACAETYIDGASVVENELSEEIVERKKRRTARYGYRV